MKLNQKGIISVVIIGLVLVLAIGAVVYKVAFNEDGTVDTTNTDTNATNSLSNPDATAEGYPTLYQQYNLPEYPGATLDYDGRTADNLSDGISLRLTTPDDVLDVGAFYASAFASLPGWTYTPPNFSNNILYGATANKANENLRFQLTVTKLPDHTQISISFLEI